jgi:hypothetical protein
VSAELTADDEKPAQTENMASGIITTFCSFKRENLCHRKHISNQA